MTCSFLLSYPRFFNPSLLVKGSALTMIFCSNIFYCFANILTIDQFHSLLIFVVEMSRSVLF